MKPYGPFLEQFKIVSKLISIQILIGICISFLFWFLKGELYGLSGLIGVGIGVIPGIFFMLLFFKRTYARATRKVVNAFYLGEALKWLITIGLFTVAFQWGKLKPLPLFVTFIATQMAYWLVPLIYEQKRTRIHNSSLKPSGTKNQAGDP